MTTATCANGLYHCRAENTSASISGENITATTSGITTTEIVGGSITLVLLMPVHVSLHVDTALCGYTDLESEETPSVR